MNICVDLILYAYFMTMYCSLEPPVMYEWGLYVSYLFMLQAPECNRVGCMNQCLFWFVCLF